MAEIMFSDVNLQLGYGLTRVAEIPDIVHCSHTVRVPIPPLGHQFHVPYCRPRRRASIDEGATCSCIHRESFSFIAASSIVEQRVRPMDWRRLGELGALQALTG